MLDLLCTFPCEGGTHHQFQKQPNPIFLSTRTVCNRIFFYKESDLMRTDLIWTVHSNSIDLIRQYRRSTHLFQKQLPPVPVQMRTRENELVTLCSKSRIREWTVKKKGKNGRRSYCTSFLDHDLNFGIREVQIDEWIVRARSWVGRVVLSKLKAIIANFFYPNVASTFKNTAPD